MDISQIIDKIKRDTEQQIKEIKNKAETESSGLIFDAHKQAKIINEQNIQKAKIEAQKYKKSLISQYNIEIKKQILSEKRKILKTFVPNNNEELEMKVAKTLWQS
jgi:vacuolar-type H+-ATPase subunit E/Vma4